MVRSASLLLALLLCATLSAQKFSPTDTVTEYTMKGTMYHNKFEGRKTAHGDIFDHNLFTAAHHKFKFGTLLLVTNQKTGLSVIVKVNDRCPKRGIVDMTRRAAWAIGIKGCLPVNVRVLPPSYEDEWASQGSLYDSVPSTLAKGQYALSKSKRNKKSKTTAAKTKHKAQQEKVEPAPEFYAIWLATAQTHGEAFSLIDNVPDEYKESVTIDTPLGDEQIDLLLDVRLSKKDAQVLQDTLKKTFPDCKIIPSE